MSKELNVYHHELRHNEYDEFYLKYEADKVIAHHKFKRCLAMAKMCGIMSAFEDGEWYAKWINKWYKIWIKIAEQLKEAK